MRAYLWSARARELESDIEEAEGELLLLRAMLAECRKHLQGHASHEGVDGYDVV